MGLGWGSIGIMEKKMKKTDYIRAYVGVMAGFRPVKGTLRGPMRVWSVYQTVLLYYDASFQGPTSTPNLHIYT